jgi:hypothetical membrane protein
VQSSSFAKPTSSCASWRVAGAVFILAGLVWFVLEAIAAAKFPAYSYARNYISDLGVPEPGVFQGRTLNSPLAWVANLMFVTQGLLFLAAAVLLVRTAAAGRGRWLFLLFAVGYAIGYAMIGAYHGSEQAFADGSFALHVAGGSLAAICGNLAIVAAGLSIDKLRLAPGYRGFCLGISGFSMLSLAMLLIDSGSASFNLLPDGIWERGGCYAIIGWEIVTGVLLVASNAPVTASAAEGVGGRTVA